MLDKIKKFFISTSFVFLLAMPASTNYKLKDYGFGAGGIGNATSPDYALNAITGQLNGEQGTSPLYRLGPGLIFTQQANVPVAPTFDNPSNYYNKLRIIIDPSDNPDDAIFAIAISTDNFVGDIRYVQNDYTVGNVLGTEDYQTYASWGGGGDEYVIGLTPGTEYKVKVKARQGKFTETGYGPIATAATISPTLTFNIDTNSVSYGNLVVDTVTDSPTITTNFATNGETGGNVFIYGQNAGLWSTANSHNINSLSGDLALPGNPEGFGAQATSVTQSSGGPLTKVSPYDLADDNVGIVDTAIRKIFSAANPIVGGQGTFVLKAKSAAITPAANDYGETVTAIVAGNF